MDKIEEPGEFHPNWRTLSDCPDCGEFRGHGHECRLAPAQAAPAQPETGTTTHKDSDEHNREMDSHANDTGTLTSGIYAGEVKADGEGCRNFDYQPSQVGAAEAPRGDQLTESDLLDIYMGHDDKGAFTVSKKCRQLVVEYRELRKRLEARGDQPIDIERLIAAITNANQVFDGWHNDGTAWSEWDESVRKELSECLRDLYRVQSKTQPNREG